MDINAFTDLVAGGAAVRRRQTLQPVGGQGDKIFPPTYPGEGRSNIPQHVFERRRVPGREEDVWCVLVDSVQSQANRLEDSLLYAIRSGAVKVPYVTVDFTAYDLNGLGEITSLDAPHRVYDAIFRDSLLDGKPFMDSAIGEKLKRGDTTTLLEVSPTALLFGSWHSTGDGGGIGAKFARALVSEITAVGVPVDEITDLRTGEITARTSGRRTGSRIDPLGVLRKVEVYKGESGWDISKQGAGKNAKQVRPSEINHGNIAPSVSPLGITCDYIEHSFVLSFAALRRLRFGTAEKDAAARTYLAAIGLLAFAEQDAMGYALRSRCDLVCEGASPLVAVAPDGGMNDLMIDTATARKLYTDAYAAAKSAGFNLSDAPLRLTPQEKLVEIVRQSQKLALEGEGGEDAPAAS
jgi:CRISPR-associated protein Csb1